MKNAFAVSVLCLMACFVSIGCQRDRGVYAGSESDYQPRPARSMDPKPASLDIEGELTRVNIPGKMFVVRLENGMEQTFKFDNDTTILGLSGKPVMRDLTGKEGSELMVEWHGDPDIKIASRVDVLQVSTSKSPSPRRRRK